MKLPKLTVGEYESILYALEECDENPGLSGKAYSKLVTKIKKFQNETEEGNPVPSLNLRKLEKKYFKHTPDKGSATFIVNDFIKFCEQNGRETDKEQPIDSILIEEILNLETPQVFTDELRQDIIELIEEYI